MLKSLTFPILQRLSDGHFHSGEALARQFNVTRATIWKAIQEAETLGIEVFSVRGRGYKLPQAVTLLDTATVTQAIGEQRHLFDVQIHPQLDSTNTYLMQQAANGAAQATCVVAELQTKGRGRRGRTWQAGLGASLTFSLLWRFLCGAAGLSGLSLTVGVALIRALRELGLTQAQLKWPNDVLVNQDQQYYKLAGILIELQGDMEGPSAAIIGIGINLNLPEQLRQQIDQPVTDVQTALGKPINSSELLGKILKHLGSVLSAFEENGFEPLREEWTQAHAYHQQAVRMLMADGRELPGIVNGVAPDGVLLVQTQQGEQRFSSGEISLRGVS
ncbi:MAG TPA: bifunctional biotin--[acetyl-CoA-carboxylase] ligase/biotin operon repressor BirA [Methylophilaceae bacterium]|jgi:BirA family biotin operon repressor/biotin-[acetyl-CoA-carboxylase] ligase